MDDEKSPANNFAYFVFRNPVRFWGKTNPAFFEGTRVATAARTLLGTARC